MEQKIILIRSGRDDMAENIKENNMENKDDNGPGLDKQGAMRRAQEEGEWASPCEYCNRGDCVECRFAYK